MSDELLRECADGLLTLTLNRPEKLNALNFDLLSALRTAFEGAADDASVRAVLLRASGRAFCAGADLTGFAGGMSLGEALHTYYHPVIEAMQALPKPIVVAARGHVAGAGLSVALAGDMVIASEDAKLVQVFGRIGLVPDAGGTWILPRLIGHARAMGMMLTTEDVSGAQAAEWGLIWQAVPDGELDDAAHALATRMANGPTRTLGLTKALGYASWKQDWYSQVALEAEYQDKCAQTHDSREGIAAFLQKRKAQFKGE